MATKNVALCITPACTVNSKIANQQIAGRGITKSTTSLTKYNLTTRTSVVYMMQAL